MPRVIKGGNPASIDRIKRKDISYVYPFDLNLRPGSDLHDRIVEEVMCRARESAETMQKRHSSWRDVDRSMTTYIPIDEEEKALLEQDNRKPVSIVVPFSYVNLKILMTYMMSALLEDPIFRFSGVGPEDVPKAVIMEHLLSYHMRKTKSALELYTAWMNAFKYGLGPIAIDWHVDYEDDIVSQSRRGLFTEYEEDVLVERVSFEGNKLSAKDPYLYLPDISLPAHKVQEMEYNGWITKTNYHSLLRTESDGVSDLFNVRYLEGETMISSLYAEDESGRGDKTGTESDRQNLLYSQPVDVVEMYIDLIPSDWGLGDRDRSERWAFKVAGDSILVYASPTGYLHRRTPVAVFSPDFDGFSVAPLARLEVAQGFQQAINFYHNSRVANTRKMVNNMLVVDPGLANFNDVVDTRHGAVIRMRRAVWGLGRINEAVRQLDIRDVTANNVGDISFLMDLGKQVIGTSDAVSGIIARRSDRVSASEANQAASAALSRLENDARLLYEQGMVDLAYMAAINVKQFMQEDTYVQLTEGLSEALRAEFGDVKFGKVPVGKDYFNDFEFDLLPHDGSIPGNHNDAPSLIQFMQILANPEIMPSFDFPRLAVAIGRRLGIKEVTSFLKRGVNMQVVPDEEAIRQAEAGNIIPTNGGVR